MSPFTKRWQSAWASGEHVRFCRREHPAMMAFARVIRLHPGHGAFYHSKAAGAMVIVYTSRVALDQPPQQNISKIFAVLRQWGCGITL